MADKEILIKVKQEGQAGVGISSGGGKGGGDILSSLLGMVGGGKGGAAAGAGAAGGVGIAASMGAMVAGLGVAVGFLGIIAAAIGILISSSKFLQKTIGRIIRIFFMLVRPIADIFATLLQPLIWILMPLVRVMRMIFRPFQQFLRQALRSRKEQIVETAQSGNFVGLAAIYMESIGEALSKWFGVVGADIVETAVMSIIDVLENLGEVIITAGRDSIVGFIEGIQTLGDALAQIFEVVFPFASDAINDVRVNFQANMGKIKEKVISAFEAEGGIRSMFKTGMQVVRDTVSDAFDHIRDKAAEVEAIVRKAKEAVDSISDPRGGGSIPPEGFPLPASGPAMFDGIITPTGSVIRTDPRDYIIATQNPAGLVGAGGGVNFDFSGMTIHAADAEDIKRKLDELVQESMSKLA